MMNSISRNEAKLQGLFRYYTGKPCKHGHDAQRFVSSRGCVVCVMARAKVWKHENLEICSAEKRAWTARNREKVRALKKHYYATDENTRKKQAQRARKWMEANRHKYRASSAKWRRANLDVAAAAQQRRRAKLLNCMPAWADQDAIQQFYTLAKELSEQTGVKHNVDHIVPLQGELVTGLHVEWNLQILTESENKSKGARFPVEMTQ